jgi:hypothetical protein
MHRDLPVGREMRSIVACPAAFTIDFRREIPCA